MVWDPRQLIPGRDLLPARLSGMRARGSPGVEGLSLVLHGSIRGQRQAASRRSGSGPKVQSPRLRGSAPTLHALLSALQDQDPAPVVPRRLVRPLSEVPLARLPRLLALLPLVWSPRARGRDVCTSTTLAVTRPPVFSGGDGGAWATIQDEREVVGLGWMPVARVLHSLTAVFRELLAHLFQRAASDNLDDLVDVEIVE